MPRIESGFRPEPLYAPFVDGGGMGMGMGFEQISGLEMLIQENYELLSHLKNPEGAYGHPSISSFLEDLLYKVEQDNAGTLQVIGEPGSGKSFIISQIVDLVEKAGIRPVYIPFVDIIRDARHFGIVDPESPFGQMDSDEYQRVSELYYTRHMQALKATEGETTLVIGECPGIPTVEQNAEGQLTSVSRGTVAVRELVSKHDAYVAGIYGSSTMRRRAKDFRFQLPQLRAENAAEVFEDYNIVTPNTDLDKAAESLRMSGAPYEAVRHYEKVINSTLAFLASEDVGKLSIPSHQTTQEYLDSHPDKRTELIGKAYIPFLLSSELHVPEDRAYIGYNRAIQRKMTRHDLSHAHYQNVIDRDAFPPTPPPLAQPRIYTY